MLVKSVLRFNMACFMRVLSRPPADTPYRERSQLLTTRSHGLRLRSSLVDVWNYFSCSSLFCLRN